MQTSSWDLLTRIYSRALTQESRFIKALQTNKQSELIIFPLEVFFFFSDKNLRTATGILNAVTEAMSQHNATAVTLVGHSLGILGHSLLRNDLMLYIRRRSLPPRLCIPATPSPLGYDFPDIWLWSAQSMFPSQKSLDVN
jgi:hypothetical protein